MRLLLTLYSRPDCHLCEEMKDTLRVVRSTTPFELEEIDINGDADLEAAYGEEIPVLLVNGQKAFRYRASVADLRARLAREQA